MSDVSVAVGRTAVNTVKVLMRQRTRQYERTLDFVNFSYLLAFVLSFLSCLELYRRFSVAGCRKLALFL